MYCRSDFTLGSNFNVKSGRENSLIFVCTLITTSYLTQRTNYSTLNMALYLQLYYLITSCNGKITSTKWAQDEISPVARSAISNFKTNPCLVVKGRLLPVASPLC